MDISFFREHMFFLFIICIVCVVAVICLYPHNKVQAQQQKVGNSDFGVVYINPDTVEAVQKDNVYYLVVSVEEVYTDKKFLEQLRSGEDMQEAVSALDLYMFTNDGRFYCTPQRFVIDKNSKVCADLGGDVQMKPVDERIITDIYVSALKVLENRQRFQSMIAK
ncbi:hypothetical protein [Megamonas hypermegale]|uniref:hypothetical protein n=1 Tax=Megamonas hypermegale TaxID=158847 RepID=UPI0026EE97CB|nr:hypothetical protein [Megamonas hypermegale]